MYTQHSQATSIILSIIGRFYQQCWYGIKWQHNSQCLIRNENTTVFTQHYSKTTERNSVCHMYTCWDKSASGTSVITGHYNCSQTVQGTSAYCYHDCWLCGSDFIISPVWTGWAWASPALAGLHWKDACAHNVWFLLVHTDCMCLTNGFQTALGWSCPVCWQKVP